MVDILIKLKTDSKNIITDYLNYIVVNYIDTEFITRH